MQSPAARSTATQPATAPASTPASNQTAKPTPQAVADLFRAYPDLAGVALTSADDSPGQVEFALQTAKALAAGAAAPQETSRLANDPTARRPELLVGTAGFRPEDARRVLDTYPSTRLLCDFQDGPWTSPDLDPKVTRFTTAAATCGNAASRLPVASVVLGDPGGPSEYVLWNDPEWMRSVSLELRRNGTSGMFLRTRGPDPWLTLEAWGVYAFQSGDVFNQKRWEKRLDDVYGAGQYAGQLLETVQHASAILPRFASLVDGESNRYMPQFGMPLVYFLELPTASAQYHPSAPQPGQAAAGSKPPPVIPWMQVITGIRADVAGQGVPNSTTPDQIADRISQDVTTCRSRLTTLTHLRPATPEQAAALTRLLDRIELNIALGEHLDQRIRAAIGWERFRKGQARDTDCLNALQLSIEPFRAATAIAERLYPAPVPFWDLQIVSEPPWTPEQVRQAYCSVTGHWRDRVKTLERELDMIRQRAAEPMSHLPVWDELHSHKGEPLSAVLRIMFSIDPGNTYRLGPGASLTNTEDVAIKGVSLAADTRGRGPGMHNVLATNPGAVRFPAGKPLEIAFMYRVMQGAKGDPEPFMAGIRSAQGGLLIGDHVRWGAPAGTVGSRFIQVPPLAEGQYVLTIDILGEAFLVIDQIWVTTPRQLATRPE